MMLLWLLACGEDAPLPPPPADPIFLRDGALLPAGNSGKVLPNGQVLAEGPWEQIPALKGLPTPLMADCQPLFQVTLEDQSRLVSMGAPAPDAALVFSPDGQRLAIGSFGGLLRIVDGWSGKTLVEKKLSEGMVKQLLWSADGTILYVGEQSPDALVLALDSTTLEQKWSRRLAEDLESSPMPPPEDVYGVYNLPGVYSLQLLEDQSLLVVGAHGWTPAGKGRQNRSRLYHLRADGELLEAWPPSGAADAVMLHPVVQGSRLLVSVSRSADGPDPAGLPIGGIALFSLDPLGMRWGRRFDVLKPYFQSVFIWEGLGLGPDRVVAGLGDGRAFLLDQEGQDVAVLSPGVPQLSQGVPIAAAVGFATLYQDQAYLLTTGTTIPFGSSDPMARPPSAHPAQNSVHAYDRDGKKLWSRQMDHALVGLIHSPDGRELLAAAGPRQTDTRTDLFGAVVLERETGAVRAICATEGPAFFRPAYAPEGLRLAVAEAPFMKEGAVSGAYRVTVFR